jgi:hypothetical protein
MSRPTVLFRFATNLKSFQEEKWIRYGTLETPEQEPSVPCWYTWTLDPHRDMVIPEVRSNHPEAPATILQELTLAEFIARLHQALRTERKGLQRLRAQLTPATPLWERVALEARIPLWEKRFIGPIIDALNTAQWEP